MAIGNQNVFSFRVTDEDKEMKAVFSEISNNLYDGSEVKIKDIILVLVRSYRADDSVVIPSQKSLLDGIRDLLMQFSHLRRDSDNTAHIPHDDDADLLDELDGLLGQFGVETDD